MHDFVGSLRRILGFALFIESSLDSACLGDRRLVTDITNHYLDVLKANVTSGDSNKVYHHVSHAMHHPQQVPGRSPWLNCG